MVKNIKYLALTLLIGLLVWANWQQPSLHQYLLPMQLLSLQVPAHITTEDSLKLAESLSNIKGVTAATINKNQSILIVSYHPQQIQSELIQSQILEDTQLVTKSLALQSNATVAGAGCPIPHSYILAIEKVRFWLNIRRLFISVQ